MKSMNGWNVKAVLGLAAIGFAGASLTAAAGTLTAAGLSKTEVVRARTTDIFHVQFRGGEVAAVAISGDGDTDLDLYVFDRNGNQICRSTRSGDDEGCRWTPAWTGTFRIEVKNLGNIANRYRIAMN